MRVTTRRRLAADAPDCATWTELAASGPLPAGAWAFDDIYRTALHGPPGEGPDETYRRAAKLISRFDYFPRWLLRGTVCTPDGRVAPGATIVLRVLLGPIGVETAARVSDVFDERGSAGRRSGFTYVTLAGHPERGCETFAVRMIDDGRVSLEVDARSRPAGLLPWLGLPVARLFPVTISLLAARDFRRRVADPARY